MLDAQALESVRHANLLVITRRCDAKLRGNRDDWSGPAQLPALRVKAIEQYPEKPGACVGSRLELMEASPGGEQAILDEIFSGPRLTTQPSRDAQQAPRMAQGYSFEFFFAAGHTEEKNAAAGKSRGGMAAHRGYAHGLLQFAKRRQHFRAVTLNIGVHVRVILANDPLWIDQEGVARRDDVVAELLGRAVFRDNLFVGIGE